MKLGYDILKDYNLNEEQKEYFKNRIDKMATEMFMTSKKFLDIHKDLYGHQSVKSIYEELQEFK